MPAMGLIESPVILPLSMTGGCIVILSTVKSGHSLYILGKPADVVDGSVQYLLKRISHDGLSFMTSSVRYLALVLMT